MLVVVLIDPADTLYRLRGAKPLVFAVLIIVIQIVFAVAPFGLPIRSYRIKLIVTLNDGHKTSNIVT